MLPNHLQSYETTKLLHIMYSSIQGDIFLRRVEIKIDSWLRHTTFTHETRFVSSVCVCVCIYIMSNIYRDLLCRTFCKGKWFHERWDRDLTRRIVWKTNAKAVGSKENWSCSFSVLEGHIRRTLKLELRGIRVGSVSNVTVLVWICSRQHRDVRGQGRSYTTVTIVF